MKKARLKKKVILPIMLVLTGTVLTVALVVYNSLTGVKADAVFDGIQKIIESQTKESVFNIVEVVPNKDMATFGFLIDGQEPDLGLSGLSALYKDDGTGAEAREKYITDLKQKLSLIVDDSEEENTKPLYYEKYEESYVNPDEDSDGTVKTDSEWEKIDLAGDEVIPAGTKGYSMKEVSDGKGDYNFGHEYEVAVNEYGNYDGDYEQNVDHYVYVGDSKDADGNALGGYYNIEFKAAKIPDGQTQETYFWKKDESGKYIHKAYKVSKAVLVGNNGDKWELDNAIKNKENMQIFAFRNGVYEYIGNTSDFVGVNIYNNMNFQNEDVYYQQVIYEYVSPEDIQNDVQYFEVDEDKTQFCPKQDGLYGEVLDTEEPYIKCTDESSSIKTLGHFKIKENGENFSFVGVGNGSYKLEKDADATLGYKVITNTVYVKTGFKNRDWFRKYVFDDDQNIKFRVNTVTPKELESLSLDTIDLLYISESGLSADKNSAYSTADDISWDFAKKICQQISSDNKKLPVILDYGKVKNCDNFYNGASYMYKLMAALSCRNSKLSKNMDGNDIYNGHYMSLDSLYSLNFNYNALLFASENDYPNGFLNGNAVYIIPSNTEGKMPFIMDAFTTALTSSNDSDTGKKFQEDAFNIGFGEIAEYINSENKTLEKQNKELLHKKISKNVIISYIIAYKYKAEIKTDKIQSLNILEIEPGRSNGYNTEDVLYKKVLYYETLKSWLGKDCPDSDNVKITRMTSAEFIGHIDDIKQYDMIYFGLNIESFNTDDSCNTLYNDSNMNGLVYSNIGDIVVIDPQNGHAGLLDTDYLVGTNNEKTLIQTLPNVNDKNYASSPNTYRASGNDLTMDKVKALEDYLDSGFPIVFSYGFFSYTSDSHINETFIDNSSNIFEFLKYAYQSTNAIAVDSSESAYNLYNVLTEGKPKVNLTAPKNSDGKEYTELNEDKLSLEFDISSVGNIADNQSYCVKLYIDSNKDGKFSKKTEEVSASSFKLYLNNDEITPQADAGGNYTYNVSAGEKYKLVYDLTHVNGLIQWKLVVGLLDNTSRYDFASGFVHEKVGSPEKVNVLQINTSGTSTYNLEEVYKDSTKSHLSGILKEVKDYDFTFHTVKSDSDELKQICKEGKLKNYNLIIMGYGEFYQIDNLDDDLKAIKEYIDEGNAVLVTHDTTSYYNFDDKSEKVWGLSFNRNLRDTVGMDRYGISTEDSPLKKGVDISKDSNETDYKQVVEYSNSKNKDIAYEPRSNRTKIIKNAQGFTFPDLNEFQKASEQTGKYGIYKDLQIGKSNATNTLILNKGQITMYPCTISASQALTLSGNPYYQLDLNQDADEDGETDLVVWYALSNWGSNSGSYEVSAGDARNNYYLYTDGNITYNGMGRSNASWQQYGELQLFVNTMIMAYDSVPHAPELLLKEDYDRNSADVNTIYTTIDDAIDQDSGGVEAASLDGIDTTRDVYFTVTDTNNLKNQITSKTRVYTQFYIECSKEDYEKDKNDKRILETGKGTVYLQEVKWQIYLLNSDGTEADLISPTDGDNIRTCFGNDKTYKIKVPISILPKGSSSIKVYAIAYSDIYKQKNGREVEVKTPETYKTFDVSRLGLADLD